MQYWWDGTKKPYYESNVSEYTKKNMTSDYDKNFWWFDENDWHNSLYPGDYASTDNKEYITKLTSNYYQYYPTTLTDQNDINATIGISSSSKAYKMLFWDTDTSKQNYFLASRCNDIRASEVYYGIFVVSDERVSSTYPLYSTGYWLESCCGVRPVVYLDSDVQLEGNSTNGYTIK